MKNILTVAVVAAALATPLSAQETSVEDVDVTFELQDVKSTVAAEFWADLEGDLETEIITLLADRIAEEGSRISVDIDEFDVSNSFQGALGVDSVLTAAIDVTNEGDPGKDDSYNLRVTVDEAAKLKRNENGAELITHDREDVYRAVIETFAEAVVVRLK